MFTTAGPLCETIWVKSGKATLAGLPATGAGLAATGAGVAAAVAAAAAAAMALLCSTAIAPTAPPMTPAAPRASVRRFTVMAVTVPWLGIDVLPDWKKWF